MRQPPRASRPHMPGYGILGPTEGTGLLPWSWAEERLARSHDYWLATTWPDGRPHVMPVWGVWLDDALWFSSSLGSRKIHNLRHDPRCVATTDDARDPVVVEGRAEIVTDRPLIGAFLDASNAKYETDYPISFLDPTVNATVRIAIHWAFGLTEADFTGSPTRWRFGPGSIEPHA
jgi:PPOX class probable F420-dependent enzyme